MNTIDDAFANIVVRNQDNIEITPEVLDNIPSVQFIPEQYKLLLRANAPIGSPPSRRDEEILLPYEIERGFIALTDGIIVTKIDAYKTAKVLVQAVYDFQVRQIPP